MKYSKEQYETAKTKDFIDCECDYCNNTFKRKKNLIYISLKRNQTELFCSKNCNYRYISKRYDYNVNCKTCGLKVEYPKVFCNHTCSAVFNNSKREKTTKGRKKEVNCSSCGIGIKVSIYASIKSYICNLCKPVKFNQKRKIIEKINCNICGKEFEPLTRRTKICSAECKKIALIKAGRNGGRKSVLSQQRRSKNEICFYNLCENKFSNVLNNEQIFNGWDADIILPDLKIAILWNGPWHYKKITQKHSLIQVQNRDRIKIKEIENCGYFPYIIKDIGKYNKNKVEKEFEIFCKWLNNKKIAGVGIEPT